MRSAPDCTDISTQPPIDGKQRQMIGPHNTQTFVQTLRVIAQRGLLIGCLSCLGCSEGEFPTRVVHGTVTFSEEKAPMGQVRFVPIDGTPGFASMGSIIEGEYRIEARGGVPVGKHRVEVDARKMREELRRLREKKLEEMTDREKEVLTKMETGQAEDTMRLGPALYAGPQSPLIVEITRDGTDQTDITMDRHRCAVVTP